MNLVDADRAAAPVLPPVEGGDVPWQGGKAPSGGGSIRFHDSAGATWTATLGDVVHYVSRGEERQTHRRCWAAIVTAVRRSGEVAITTFGPGQVPVPIDLDAGVPYDPMKSLGSWHVPEDCG